MVWVSSIREPFPDTCPVSASLDRVTRYFSTVMSLVSVQGTKADHTHSSSGLSCSIRSSYPTIRAHFSVSCLYQLPRAHFNTPTGPGTWERREKGSEDHPRAGAGAATWLWGCVLLSSACTAPVTAMWSPYLVYEKALPLKGCGLFPSLQSALTLHPVYAVRRSDSSRIWLQSLTTARYRRSPSA